MNRLKPIFLFLAAVILSPGYSIAQTHEIDGSSSNISIEGTSTLHDWHSQANDVSGTATVRIQEGQLKGIDALSIIVVVRSIESGKGGMDKNTYKALKEEEYPEIKFTLTRHDPIASGTVTSYGLLTIAGIARDVTLTTDFSISNENEVVFEGSQELKMSDFEIDPPTALMGTVKTGDPVTIHFKVTFRKQA